MAERTTVTQQVQIGVESTPGTAAPANRLLQALGLDVQPQASIQQFRPAGQKYTTITALGQEWIQANLSGAATYTELIYPLSSILEGSVAPVEGSSGAYEWTFATHPGAPDSTKTFTIEQGSSVRAHRFTNAIVTALGLNITRQQIELSGTLIAAALEDGVAMTAAPTAIPLVPILPTQVDVFLDTDASDIGTTQLDRAFVANLQLGDRFTPFWPIDSRLGASFGGVVEGVPTATLNLTMAADATGMGILSNLRDGGTVFVRIQATGPEIEVGHNYSLTIDMACQVGDVNSFEDQDGIYSVSWPLVLVRDPDWGQVIEVTIVNDQADLGDGGGA